MKRTPNGIEFIQLKKFNELDLNDPFFDSLRKSYNEFNSWFQKKADSGAIAYVTYYDHGYIQAFLYLKEEHGIVNDITPNINIGNILKVGTFKVDPHNTRLGQRFLKKIIDQAIASKSDFIYVTVFEEFTSLIQLLTNWGFQRWGIKESTGELVFVKTFTYNPTLSPFANYPVVDTRNVKKYLLGIYPEYHTRLFPDSILTTENYGIINDETHSNSINKVYLCRMRDINKIRPNDLLIIYRTQSGANAEYSSVATSLCKVLKMEYITAYRTEKEFVDTLSPLSVFTEKELKDFYSSQKYPFIIWFTYNAAFQKRIIRRDLINIHGLSRKDYWGFMGLNDTQFMSILNAGGIDDRIIIH